MGSYFFWGTAFFVFCTQPWGGYSYLIYCLGEEGTQIRTKHYLSYLFFTLLFPLLQNFQSLAFTRDIASKDLCCIPRDSFEGQVHRGAVQRRSLWTPAIVSACHSPNMSRDIQSTTLRSLPLAECGEIRQEIRTPETQAGEPQRAGNIHWIGGAGGILKG